MDGAEGQEKHLGEGEERSESRQEGMKDEVDDENRRFDSIEEQADFYRSKYREIKANLEETKLSLIDQEDFATNFELEIEQLTTLQEQTDEENQRLQAQVEKLVIRVEDLEHSGEEWRKKYGEVQKQFGSATDSMTREIEKLKQERDEAKRSVVMLEQGTDDLEQEKRYALSSILDLRTDYNKVLEEKTMLEEEVIGKTGAENQLREELQRAKDDLRDQTEDLENSRTQLFELQSQILNLRLQLERSQSRTTPPTELIPLPRAEFMSPVQEASFETASPMTALGTPTPVFPSSRSMELLMASREGEGDADGDGESMMANTSHSVGGSSASTPYSGATTPSKGIPIAISRQRLAAPRLSTPPSAVKRSATSSGFQSSGSYLPTPSPPKYPPSPRPLRTSMYGPAALNRSQVSRNLAIAAASVPPASPAPRVRPASHLGASTSTVQGAGRAMDLTTPGGKQVKPAMRMAAEAKLRLATLRSRLSYIDMRSNKEKKVDTAAVEKQKQEEKERQRVKEAAARSLGKSTLGKSTRAKVTQGGTPARVAALLGESKAGPSRGQDQRGVIDIGEDSGQTSWVVVKDEDGFSSPEMVARSMDHDGPNISTSSKPLPERPGIPSPLAVTHRSFESSTSEGTLKPARPSSRISSSHSGITVTSSSSSSEDVRPETPYNDRDRDVRDTRHERHRQSASVSGGRPGSALGYRPGSSMSVRPSSVISSSRPGSAFGHRPESAASSRSHMMGMEPPSARRAGKSTSSTGLPNTRPMEGKVYFPGSETTSHPPSSASSSRPASRQSERPPSSSSSAYISPYAQRSRAPSGVSKSPSLLNTSTRLPISASDSDLSGVPRPKRRQSTGPANVVGSNLPVPVASGRRSVSGRPQSVDLENSLRTAPPVPPMSPMFRSMADAKKGMGMGMGVGMGYPSPIKER